MRYKKKPLRRPDGQPELRSLDDLLQQAASGKDFENLPGKGKPLDLATYFKGGPENRLANQILKNNQILPQHLQDRKNAEQHIQAAEHFLQSERARLATLLEEIHQISGVILAAFPHPDDFISCLGFQSAPVWLSPGEPHTEMPLGILLEATEKLSLKLAQYNLQISNVTRQYLAQLQQAEESILSYQKQVLSTGRLFNDCATPPATHMAEKKARILSEFTPLPLLPPDASQRLRAWHRKTYPAFWKRLLSSG